MKAYWLYFKMQVGKYFEYRFNVITSNVRSLINIIAIVFLWSSIYNSNHFLPGYSFSLLIVYYLLILVFSKLTSPNVSKNMETYIKTGAFANLQIKPTSIRVLLFIEDISENIINVPFILCVFLIILAFSPSLRSSFHPSIIQIFLFFFGYLFAITLNYLSYLIIGTATFWLTNISGIRNTFKNGIAVFTGVFVPLTLFPQAVQNVLHYLPFTYMLYFPINILLGKFSNGYILQSLCIAIIWIIFLYLVNNILWHKGLQVYESAGN